jgi:hypothetical protein
MKLSGYLVFGISIFIVIFLASPVYADETYPTITHVFFEKDGVPYNESVHYIVNCYGHYEYPWVKETTSPSQNGTAVPEIVFTYSATCPSYGCSVYEPYYLNYRVIDSCDLEGQTVGSTFILKNFSTSPLPQDCADFQQFTISNGSMYWNNTPEYDKCMNESYIAADLCDAYLSNCSPSIDTDCGNWIVDGRFVKDSPKSLACRKEVDTQRDACRAFLKTVDPSTMIMWKDPLTGQEEGPAMRNCTARFEIQSGNNSFAVFVPGEPEAHILMTRDTESIWCRIVQFFGGKCE